MFCIFQARITHVDAAELVRQTNQDELPSREAQLLTLENTKEFDVLVIGGGATGCGCALDAVSRGMELGILSMSPFYSINPRIHGHFNFLALKSILFCGHFSSFTR